MTHVRAARFRNRVVIDVDNAIQIECNNLGDIMQLLKVVPFASDEGGESDRGKVAHSSLICGGVFHYFCAEIGRPDSAKVLLVRFPWNRISHSQENLLQ